MPGYVYILASDRNGTLYVGVTTDLIQRISQHREKTFGGFTEKYGVTRLVWYEVFDDIQDGILREKQIKKWNRDWKIKRIEELNPRWDDLFPQLF